MEKILGIDLGTNSIGWAIRDAYEEENQIIDKGVLRFEKGVGEGKSGEFPLVQKRTESRHKRRNYQAEKYRKWALLEALIKNGLCPLSMEGLNAWRKYSRIERRKYPQEEQFIQWLRYDFNGDGKPDFEEFGFCKNENHYLFRALAIKEEFKGTFQAKPHILGRILYHLVQRRGFRGRDEAESKTILEGNPKTGTVGVDNITPYIERHKTLGAALYYAGKEEGVRILKRYNLRSDYENELKEICRVQRISDSLYKKLWKAIIWQRPLRSQKGLVGYCTFEAPVKDHQDKFLKAGKKRCPISHPLYEEFRAFIFINNLRIQLPEAVDYHRFIIGSVYPLFLKTAKDFKLTAIEREVKKVGGVIRSKFDSDTKVVSCSLLHHFEKLFGSDWKNQLGWDSRLLNLEKTCPYSFEDVWHVLFSFDSKEKLKEFALAKLCLKEKEAEAFSNLKLQQGYATLSLSAIKKILPFLYQGFIYSEAVYLANLPKVLNVRELSNVIIEEFSALLREAMLIQSKEKQIAAVVNSLISDQLNSASRYGMDVSYRLDADDYRDIEQKIQSVLGIKSWHEMGKEEKADFSDQVTKHYLGFLQKPVNAKKESLFLKPQRLHDRIFASLRGKYGIPEENKKHLWHPSEQEIYVPAKEKNGIPQLGDPMPVSNGFKNPMALKTLFQLKSLINYLLQERKIDEDTRVVVEIARELNDANKRKAIKRWQQERERQNEEFKERIREIAKECELDIDPENKAILDKYRLWVEQKQQCFYTGKFINCCDLFNGTRFDFEHTIPASISFDNELKNLTIADSRYNRQIKTNRIPSDLPNYEKNISIEGVEYTAIRPRLKFMEEEVVRLEKLLSEWKNKTRFASTKEIKDACIQKRHMLSLDMDYWRKKLDTFTCKEYKVGWRNSQLKDTQIVTKYALPYLKTVFNKVEVQKGSVTAAFREIYSIQPRLEKKNRTKHSHHAIDAAILTLIPPAAIRDKILQRYNEEKDHNPGNTYHEKPRQWKNFHVQHIFSIEDDVLINFQSQHRFLVPAIKQVRKKGRLQFVKEKLPNGKWHFKRDPQGNKIPLISKGDSIRGQLHKDSFFGAIKLNGEFLLVERYPISAFSKLEDCNHIVDQRVREIVYSALAKRVAAGESFERAKQAPIYFPNNKEVIRKVRCKVAAGRGYLTPEKALEIRKSTSPSKHDYKQNVYAQNFENALCLYYEGLINGNTERAFRVVGLFELATLKLPNIKVIAQEQYYKTVEVVRGRAKAELPLSYILQTGCKVIFYKESVEELKCLTWKEIIQRLYIVKKFNLVGSPYIYLQFHLEARPDDILGDGDTLWDNMKYQPRLKLKAEKFNCAIEGKHFNISVDGEIKWL